MKKRPRKLPSVTIKDVVEEDDDGTTTMHQDSGEFFFGRYRLITPDAKPIPLEDVRQALRVNTEKITITRLMKSLNHRGAMLKPIPWLRNGYFVNAPFSLGATQEYLLGHYYLQGPLSQLACEILDPAPGSHVLDMASAPGGKTTYLAQLVGEKGVVVALDSDAIRLAAVRNNAERLGLANVLCVKKDARFCQDMGMKFPFVLLDAPCSGNFCSDKDWFSKRTIGDITSNARVQRELLRAAYAVLAPGGHLLYSTCSLEPEEDELAVDWALKKYSDLDVVELDIPLGDPGTTSWAGQELDSRITRTRRFWPHKTSCEGFFIALLEKKKK